MKTLTFNDILLTLRGNAYLDHDTQRGVHYTTLADDAAGNEYRVYWYVGDEINVFEADDCVCWDNPDEIRVEAIANGENYDTDL